MKLLQESTENMSLCDKVGQSILYVACSGGFIDVVKMLVERKVDVSQCGKYGNTQLYA